MELSRNGRTVSGRGTLHGRIRSPHPDRRAHCQRKRRVLQVFARYVPSGL